MGFYLKNQAFNKKKTKNFVLEYFRNRQKKIIVIFSQFPRFTNLKITSISGNFSVFRAVGKLDFGGKQVDFSKAVDFLGCQLSTSFPDWILKRCR